MLDLMLQSILYLVVGSAHFRCESSESIDILWRRTGWVVYAGIPEEPKCTYSSMHPRGYFTSVHLTMPPPPPPGSLGEKGMATTTTDYIVVKELPFEAC